MFKLLLSLILVFLPWPLRRHILTALGHDIAPDSRIGFSLVAAKHIKLGDRSCIGHLNFIRNLDQLVLEDCASIGNLNWITGLGDTVAAHHFTADVGRSSLLHLGTHTAITHRHLIDCTHAVTFGSFTTFAGYRSQILTHGIDVATCKQASAPVVIGSYCLIGTGCLILKNANLPDRCVLGAGSVLTKKLEEPNCLYAGSPPVKIRNHAASDLYFNRLTGRVS